MHNKFNQFELNMKTFKVSPLKFLNSLLKFYINKIIEKISDKISSFN